MNEQQKLEVKKWLETNDTESLPKEKCQILLNNFDKLSENQLNSLYELYIKQFQEEQIKKHLQQKAMQEEASSQQNTPKQEEVAQSNNAANQEGEQQELEKDFKEKLIEKLKKVPTPAYVGLAVIIVILGLTFLNNQKTKEQKERFKNATVEMVCETDIMDKFVDIIKNPGSKKSLSQAMEIQKQVEQIAVSNGFESVQEMDKVRKRFEKDNEFMKEVEAEMMANCNEKMTDFASVMFQQF